MKKLLSLSLLALLVTGFTLPQFASAAPKKQKSLSDVCTKVVKLDERKQFYKNNKPMRASSAINAPVIGYFRQMTLANNAGVRNSIGTRSVKMYDRKGNTLSNMTVYPCRSDHCGGRVVSTTQTQTARRAAIARTKKPRGYVQLTGKTCMLIEDIGRCYGEEVNKSRPLCNQVVG